VEFRLGEIENLPVADNAVDVIISNCVINLSPNKERVFEEAFRVLKPGGRLMISDIVLLKELPEIVEKSEKAYIACISGAIMKNKYIKLIKDAGFRDVKIAEETRFQHFSRFSTASKDIVRELNIPLESVREFGNSVASIKVYGAKPNK
jgi:arsenite methyltransferase